MMIGLLADTHDRLPAISDLLDAMVSKGVSLVMHAGDYCAPFALKPFNDANIALLGIFGRNDGDPEGLKATAAQGLGMELYESPHSFEVSGHRILIVHDIGEVPLNGAQHGNAIVYLNGATGTVSGNNVYNYQKNGITVSGTGTSVSVLNNTVTGEGPITYIAQNGIQISFGATAQVVGNSVTGNDYSPPKVTACGLLIYKAGGVSASTKGGISFIRAENNIHGNETDICNFGKGGSFSPAP